MTRRVEGQDAMHGVHGKEDLAARGGEANQLYLNYRNSSSLQQQGNNGINYIAFAGLSRRWRDARMFSRAERPKSTFYN
ncbi:hypothetical protein SAMN05421878_11811 [Actinobaculum suis]|uniref:Uncharacterized protein n=1 Tax=Actinobaculum suis TaxID=1657 RepID=A0A1G7EI26_9ACTO|nr:hypothetical protein SAMN05421878_11811 [Actinobaculum suis]